MGRTKSLMVQYGFPGGEVLADGSFFCAVVRLCRILPLPALLLVFFRFARQREMVSERKRCLHLLWNLARVAAAAVSILVIVGQVRIPEDLIPTKWSDFDFYVQKCGEARENLLRLAMLPLSE